MTIDNKTVDEIAHLARLEFAADAKAEIIKDMNNMLAFVEKLNELNTDNIQPLIYMTDEKDIMREDEAKVTISQQEALKNAPKRDSDYFKVPKVIDNK
ncbi:MAG TPA: Asp-tRNA(Asn)/Glu-tRNA(Gln) amidotransferase subunit GatC [Bacteroidia bacterium]